MITAIAHPYLSERLDEMPVLGILALAVEVHAEERVAPARVLVEQMRRHSAVAVALVHDRHYVVKTPYLHLKQALNEESALNVVADLQISSSQKHENVLG